MSTRKKPGKFACFHKLSYDEPYFVLRAKDPHAPILVELWTALREEMFGETEKFFEARRCAEEMKKWQKENGIKPLRERTK